MVPAGLVALGLPGGHSMWAVPHWQLLDLHELHPLDVMAEGQGLGSLGVHRGSHPGWGIKEPSLERQWVDEVNCPSGSQLTL